MKSSRLFSYKLAELVADLDVVIQGDTNCMINGVSPIQFAEPGHITFLTNSLYKKYLTCTQASAVILTQADAAYYRGNAIITSNPHYIYAKIASFFADPSLSEAGIHASAVIGHPCDIHASVRIAAGCVIGNQVKIHANVIIGAGTIIGDEVEIDEDTQLDARVTVYQKVKIGKRSRIASGAVIGSDGFGFANQAGVWHKVPQLGSVVIADDVDVGANTTIDRGAVGDTCIANGVKLDNLIQIGHNVCIGDNTIIAGCVAIAGSVSIGKNCMIGGKSSFAGHISICDNTMITGMTAVTKSIVVPGIYSSGIVGAVTNKEFKKNNARFHRLENFVERIKKLEALVKTLVKNPQKNV